MGSRQDKLNWLMSQKFENTVMNGLSFLVVFLILLFYLKTITITSFYVVAILLFIFLIILSMSFSQKKVINYLQWFNVFLLFYVGLLSFYSWWFGTYFFGQLITDNRIMVIITLAYVFTTYLLVKSQNDNFKKSRLPTLSFYLKNNFDLCIENSSNYIARKPKLYVQINYPLLESLNPIHALRWHWSVKKESFELDYPDVFQIGHPKSNVCVSMRRNLEKKLLSNNFSGVTKFDILIDCSYEADDILEERWYDSKISERFKVTKNKIKLIS